MGDNMIIAVDFDGTCVTHEFPKIGRDIGAEPVLKKLVARGHLLILLTMRSDLPDGHNVCDGNEITPTKSGYYLQDAINWFNARDIPLWSVNNNPEQIRWTSSRKVYANLYIDDLGVNIPLSTAIHSVPYVDWIEVEKWLVNQNIL